MIRGTTPTHIFDTDISLVDAEEIYITYKQGRIILEKTIADIQVTENQDFHEQIQVKDLTVDMR